MEEERIEVTLGNGYKIVVERNYYPDLPEEVYVGIEKDGMWIQDLVCVRNAYRVINDKSANPEAVEMLIYGNAYDEDYTDKVIVDIYKDEEEN